MASRTMPVDYRRIANAILVPYRSADMFAVMRGIGQVYDVVSFVNAVATRGMVGWGVGWNSGAE